MSPMDLDEILIAALEESRDKHEEDYSHMEHCKSGQDCVDFIVVSALQIAGELDAPDEVVVACLHWVLDDTVTGLVLKGYVEPYGIDEDGEMTIGLTAAGREASDNFNNGR